MERSMSRTQRNRCSAKPAIALPVAAPGGHLLFNAALLSVAWGGQQVLAIQMPRLPKISLPKISLPKVSLPKLPLPNFGKKDAAAPAPPQEVTTSAPSGPVKVRAAASPQSAVQAPTFSESIAKKQPATKGSADGWKRFPARRMPGANMDPWKEISREIMPKV